MPLKIGCSYKVYYVTLLWVSWFFGVFFCLRGTDGFAKNMTENQVQKGGLRDGVVFILCSRDGIFLFVV